jgi:hypothetical protein
MGTMMVTVSQTFKNDTNPTIKNTSYVYPYVYGWNIEGNIHHIVANRAGTYVRCYDQKNLMTIEVGNSNWGSTMTQFGHLLSVNRITQQQYDCLYAQRTGVLP